MWFDVHSELGGGTKLFYVWMEIVSFEIKERGGLMFKKELGGGVWPFKGGGLLWSEKRLLDVQKIIYLNCISSLAS